MKYERIDNNNTNNNLNQEPATICNEHRGIKINNAVAPDDKAPQGEVAFTATMMAPPKPASLDGTRSTRFHSARRNH